MNEELNKKAEAFAAQWCHKNDDYRAVRLAYKAGFVESQKIKDLYFPYKGLIGLFRRIWLTWHKAKYDSLEALYLHVFLAERQIELERLGRQQKTVDVINNSSKSLND